MILREKKGQTLVEMGIIIPIVLLIAMMIIEIGLYINANMVTTNAAREAVRVAAVKSDEEELGSIIADIEEKFSVNITIGYPEPGDSRVIGEEVKAVATKNYKVITLAGQILGGENIAITQSISMMVEN
ncbi:MAG: hypothetical protein GT589_08600 [Peptoclostridium sp.]|uniref:TadE family protein n=1 Tax=Peptoclostridium sp. TaxID=1904860 RepID=UPI00139AC4C2|nr:TadE family protein [Peptoclostridium sp.]MZQ76191.1 hypothetical protein [Peptoclostridium sp.]